MILINGSATQWGKLINRWRERVGLRSIRKEARYQLIRESEASRAEEISFEKWQNREIGEMDAADQAHDKND